MPMGYGLAHLCLYEFRTASPVASLRVLNSTCRIPLSTAVVSTAGTASIRTSCANAAAAAAAPAAAAAAAAELGARVAEDA